MRFLSLFLLPALLGAADPAPKLILAEDFEGTAVGAIPAGYTKDGAVAVVDDVSHSGRKSLRLEPAVRGGRRINRTGAEIDALGGEHWGRLYFRVKLPTPPPPVPAEGKKFAVIHHTMVSGKALSPSFDDPIEVRMLGACYGSNGGLQYIYNVQPAKRPEFANGTKYTYKFTDAWTLAEWHVDYATQTFQLFLDGEEVKEASFSKGAGKFEKAEVPAAFKSLSFGWTNYQAAQEPGFTAWIDDIALAKTRIGPVRK